MLPTVNYLAVLFAALAGIIIDLIWYSKKLFGKTRKKDSKSYVISFIFTILMSYVLALIISAFGANSILGSLKTSFLVWLGFVIPIHLSGILWKEETFRSFALEALSDLISIVVMGIIIVLL